MARCRMIAHEGNLRLEHSESDVRSPMSRLPHECLNMRRFRFMSCSSHCMLRIYDYSACPDLPSGRCDDAGMI